MALQVQVQVQPAPSGQLVVVALAGELDLGASGALRSGLEQATAFGPRTVVVDLAGVTFLDSSALGLLVAASRALTASGGRLLAVNASGIALRAMQVTGVTQVFPVHGAAADLGADLDAELDVELADLLGGLRRS